MVHIIEYLSIWSSYQMWIVCLYFILHLNVFIVVWCVVNEGYFDFLLWLFTTFAISSILSRFATHITWNFEYLLVLVIFVQIWGFPLLESLIVIFQLFYGMGFRKCLHENVHFHLVPLTLTQFNDIFVSLPKNKLGNCEGISFYNPSVKMVIFAMINLEGFGMINLHRLHFIDNDLQSSVGQRQVMQIFKIKNLEIRNFLVPYSLALYLVFNDSHISFVKLLFVWRS